MRQARLVSARIVAPNVRELTFDGGPDFTFVPGQWVSFRIPASEGEDFSRSYSIASAPRSDALFDIAVTRVEGGPGSGFLHEIEVGTSLMMSDSQGFFTLTDLTSPVLMVATGTGVCPFRSMLQFLISLGPLPHPIALLLGVRTEADILYRDEFEKIATQSDQFRFSATLSRGESTWEGKRGYVQTHTPELVRELEGESHVYVCGLSRMVKDVRQLLKTELGLPKQRIHTERYD